MNFNREQLILQQKNLKNFVFSVQFDVCIFDFDSSSVHSMFDSGAQLSTYHMDGI